MAKGVKTGGRTKGSTNKITKSFKELLHATYQALESTPGKSMKEWALNNQTEFYRIASKLIPTELQHSGEIQQLIISKTVINKPRNDSNS